MAANALHGECIPGERVYASVDARSARNAIRLFKERQLAADYEPMEEREAAMLSSRRVALSLIGAI